MHFHAQVVIGQSFPLSIFLLLNQHLERLPQELLAKCPALLLIEIKQTLAASFLDSILDLSVHTSCCCTLALRETENVHLGECQFLCCLIGQFKVLVGLTWKSGD